MISNITVIDSIMGSGKTSWSIQEINKSSREYSNFLYITPFLNEVERILIGTNREFRQPINKGKGKLWAINELFSCQEDIASTHELFKHLDEDSKRYIEEGHYTLILDEVLNVVEPYDDIKNDDMKLLKESNCIRVDDDGFVIWNKEKADYDTKYNEIKIMAENHSLMYVNQKLLLWRYPPEIFLLFEKVYILTYLFESSILKYYFDLYNVSYDKKSIKKISDEFCMVDYYKPDTSEIAKLINVYNGKLNNNFQQKFNALSKTWFTMRNNNEKIIQIKNNLYNYFYHTLGAKADTVMWTTFKDVKDKLKGKGYTNSFVAFNCRSTNDYVNTFNLAYCVNVFLHPGTSQFFKQHNVVIAEEMYALSEMLQWIWRSRIRSGKSINIYIPSIRMRELLKDWMNSNIESSERIA